MDAPGEASGDPLGVPRAETEVPDRPHAPPLRRAAFSACNAETRFSKLFWLKLPNVDVKIDYQ